MALSNIGLMDEKKFREMLRQPIITKPPEKIAELFGPTFRNTLVLQENEINEIIERAKRSAQ